MGIGKLILHSACKAYGARVLIQAQTIMTSNNMVNDIIPPLSLDYDCCASERKPKLNDIHLDLPLRNIVNCLENLRLASHKVKVDKLPFSSYGRLCSSELVQVVDRFLTTPTQEPPSYRNCHRVSWRRKGYFGGSPGGP